MGSGDSVAGGTGVLAGGAAAGTAAVGLADGGGVKGEKGVPARAKW